ncbi:MAG: alkaline phosphatase PhoX, partial [Thermoanaerobaculia bacterium]
HENAALRCETGKRLAVYMGDDRRGGHVWKYVSDALVDDPTDAATSRLLERGTLYAARFHDDFTGEWIPILPSTPLYRPQPEHLASDFLHLPARPEGGTVAVRDHPGGDGDEITVDEWCARIEAFAGKPFADCALGDLVRPETATEDAALGILLLDAFAMANACGATPTARPEDLEVHPGDRTVYVAFTDATDSSEGSPDRRIFPDSAKENSRQYGAVYRLIEGGVEGAASDPAATSFTWGKFVASGEAADHGGGFACADNLAFDPHGNLWLITDITTNAQNFPARGSDDRGDPGKAGFPGVFGNNSMFVFATAGPDAGVPRLFALAPMDAELCGPSFTDDGRALVLSVQHPGEKNGVRTRAEPTRAATFVVHDRDGQPFEQARTIPRGSNFPSGELDRAPRPSVVCITRATPSV